MAAREMFARDGFERTSIRAIAARCGLSDAAVLYHFRSKHQLLSALLVEPDIAPIEPVTGGDAAAVIDQVLDNFLAWVDNGDLARVVLAEALASHRGAGEFRTNAYLAFRESLHRALAHLDVPARDEACEVMTRILSGAMIDGIMQWGADFPRVAHGPSHRTRLRRQCELVLAVPAMGTAAQARAGCS